MRRPGIRQPPNGAPSAILASGSLLGRQQMPVWDMGVVAKARQIAIFASAAHLVAWRQAASSAACPKPIGEVSEKLRVQLTASGEWHQKLKVSSQIPYTT